MAVFLFRRLRKVVSLRSEPGAHLDFFVLSVARAAWREFRLYLPAESE